MSVVELNTIQAHPKEDFPASRANPSSSTERKSAWPIQGNRRGLLAALGVGVVLVILVISAAVYVNQNSGDKNETKQRLVANNSLKQGEKSITLPDILTGVFGFRTFNGSWISDTEIQYFDSGYNLVLFNVTTNTVNLLIDASVFIEKLQSIPNSVTLSPDRKFALVAYQSQKLYRHSLYARYAIYNFQDGSFAQVHAEPADQNENQRFLLQLVEWSPRVGHNAVAFVYDNDVYVKPGPTDANKSIRLTTTGGSQIFNGVADWVYEEEMFSGSKALWFSPEGTHLAFASFNDTRVRSIQFVLYGTPGRYPENQYPLVEDIPYPKAGTPNPSVKMFVANLASTTVPPPVEVQLEKYGPASYYIGTALWATDNELVVVTLNRGQNDSRTLLCKDGACDQILQTTQANGWIDIHTPLASKDGQRFLMLRSEQVGDESYHHIVQFTRTNQATAVTTGKFSVDSITAWDEANNKVYFTATLYNETLQKADPSQSHLYSVVIGQKPVCITCGVLNLEKKTECQSNSIALSKGYGNFVHTCGGPSVPEVVIRPTQSTDTGNVLIDNVELKTKLQSILLPIIQDYDIPLAGGFTGKARLWIPPHYQKGKKYPLLVDVYGGPGSQKLNRGFSINWGTSLTLSRDVIYASIDGRGSGRQSDDLLFQLHRRLGTVEIEDQIAGAKWLIENNVDDIIDANRTAIWGWSYGGYSTAMVMGTDKQGIYKCGISVAPVTSWVFYDTIYTERYMGLPTLDDNIQGYNASDVTNHLENFRTKKFYLIHGNADDNVHYQQSMILSRALEKADILFRQQSYPDEDHSLGSVRRHLYHSLENFLFEECF